MRTVKDPDERKNEILDTAEALFYTKGYTKTTVNDILEAIGIAKGTFYYHYKSKEEVLDAIILRIVSADVAAAKEIAADERIPAGQKLYRILLAQKPGDGGHKDRILAQFEQVGNAEMRQKSLVQTVIHLGPVLAEVVEQGNRQGVFAAKYPRETVEFLLTSSTMLLDNGLFHWQPGEATRKVEAFVHLMEVSLGAQPGSLGDILRLLFRPGQE